MTIQHKRLVQEANDAIDRVFGDTSVSQQQTLNDLQELQSNIEGKIDALKDDIEKDTGVRP